MKLTVLIEAIVLASVSFATNQQNPVLIPPYTCTTTICQPGHLNPPHSDVQSVQGKSGKRGSPGMKGDKGDPCQCEVLDEQVVAALRDECNTLKQDYISMENRVEKIEGILNVLPENCTAYYNSRNDRNSYDIVPIYPLKFIGDLTPLLTDCKDTIAKERDGWIPIQRRQDGGTDFYRNWESYVSGFGDRKGEFWIGLKTLHLMTSMKSCKLRVDFRDWDKSTRYAEYSTFQVADEASLFRLSVSGYSGTIKDSMTYHNGRRFSSYDKDNDDHTTIHCAEVYKGAWWHGACHYSNLNGQYFKTETGDTDSGVWWEGFSISLPFVEMKLLCA